MRIRSPMRGSGKFPWLTRPQGYGCAEMTCRARRTTDDADHHRGRLNLHGGRGSRGGREDNARSVNNGWAVTGDD